MQDGMCGGAHATRAHGHARVAAFAVLLAAVHRARAGSRVRVADPVSSDRVRMAFLEIGEIACE
eukprot:3997014-Prymnesium_polylepis.1